MNDYVRRRRWVRRRRRAGTSAAPPVSVAAALGPQRKAEQEPVLTKRQLLGRAAPGEALPLPLGWNAAGRQLQLRPVLPAPAATAGVSTGEGEKGRQQEGAAQQGQGKVEDEEPEQELQALHGWSFGTADGRHTLKLDSLDEGITRLVCCPTLGNTGKRRWWAVSGEDLSRERVCRARADSGGPQFSW